MIRHGLDLLAPLLPGLALALTFGPACGEGGGKVPLACRDRTLPTLELPPGAGPGDAPGREAVVAVIQREDRIAGDRAGNVKILLFDFATYQGQAAPVDMDGENCWRVVGQPVIDTPPTALTVSNVQVDGLASGPLAVGSVTGAYSSSPVPSILGTDDLRVQWETDTTGAATFSSVDETFTAAAPLADLATTREAIGSEMRVTWTPTGATWIEIQLTTNDPADPRNPKTRNRMICRVLDDGCQPISAGSLDWLSLNTDTASIRVERHEIRRVAPEPGTLLTLETLSIEENEVALQSGLLAGEGTP